MKIEIDQSNKIERTDKDTIIGFSNGKTFTVLIKGKVKRQLQEEFRKSGKPKLFIFRTFMAWIALLIKYSECENISQIIIDKEYPGREEFLKNLFLEMCSKYFKNPPVVEFKCIGRNSKAHAISYYTMRGKYKPDKIININDIKRIALK